jgi:hypothetical protein
MDRDDRRGLQAEPDGAAMIHRRALGRLGRAALISTAALAALSGGVDVLADSSTPPATAAKAKPESFANRCEADDECVVAYAIAGLDHIPKKPKRELCGTLCFVGVPKTQLENWNAARARLEPLVPCDKKFPKCGGLDSRHAICRSNRCVLE